MARAKFSEDAILDAVRDIVVSRGPRAATVDAIARASGAPVGSIYHRFRSVDEVLARTWLRAVRRTQEAALAVEVDGGEPVEAAVSVALALYDHCVAEPGDTLLLGALRHEEALRLAAEGALAAEVATVNDHITALMGRLARALFGRADRRAVDLVVLALVDLPSGFVRSHLEAGRRPPAARRERLPDAVRAVLAR